MPPARLHALEKIVIEDPTPPQPSASQNRPRQGRVHLNRELARPRPLETIPHALAVLMMLDQRRFLTARQISRLFLREEAEALLDPVARARALAAADRQVNRRILRPLKDSELVTVVRPFLTGATTPLARKEVNVLTAQGAALVRQAYLDEELGRQLKWHRGLAGIDNTNQAHAALLNDVFILLRRSMGCGWTLRGWRDDRDLAQLVQQGAASFGGFVPDAVFVLSLHSDTIKDEHFPFMLELDRGTESVFSLRQPTRDWTAKIERYLAGAQQTDPLWRGITHRPVVLTLAPTAARRDSLLEASGKIGGDDRFCFGTYQPLLSDADPRQLCWEYPWQRPGGSATTLAQFLSGPAASLRAS
jgi:hypothetical protein